MSSYWFDKTRDGYRVHCERRGVIAEDVECIACCRAIIAEYEAADAADEIDDEDCAPFAFEMARAA